MAEESKLSHQFFIGKAEKLSGWQWSFHQRLLQLENNILSYYRKVPKDFVETNQQAPKDVKPKSSVCLEDAEADAVTAEDKAKSKKLDLARSFKVTFNSNAVVGAKQSKKPKTETWFFTVASEKERDDWVARLKRTIEPPPVNEGQKDVPPPLQKAGELSVPVPLPEVVESSKKPSFLEPPAPITIPEENKEISESVKGSSVMSHAPLPTPKLGSENRRGEQPEQDPEDKWLDEIEDMHKYQQLLIEKKQRHEARAWDLKFQKYWGMIVAADKNFDESIKASEQLIDHVGKFRRTATFYAKLIVNEMHRPVESRMFRPLIKLDRIIRHFCDDDPSPEVYAINKMLFKITSKDSEVKRSLGSETFIEYKWKSYGREFLAMDIMFDALFILSKPKNDFNLRIPLSCLVDYKGHRAIVYGLISLNDSLEPTLGLREDGTYHEDTIHGVARQMPFIAEVLNLKDHNFLFKKTTQPIHVAISPLIEVHRRDNTRSGSDEEQDTGEFPEKRKEMDFHIYELDYDEDVYYVLKTSEIFPIDYSLQDRKPYDTYLRPEFVCKFEKALRTDAQKRRIRLLSQLVDYESGDDGQLEIGEAKQQLLSGVVPRVVDQLDSLNIIPIESATLTQVFHSEGLNMRYLGIVAEQSILSHVKDICVAEMLARTLKNVLHEQLSYTLQQTEEKSSLEEAKKDKRIVLAARVAKCKRYKGTSENFVLVTSAEKDRYDKLLDDPMHGQLFEDIYDFLNMVFGKDPDTDEFWDQILFPRAAQSFNYPVEKFNKSKVNLNALFFAFVFHFGLELDLCSSFELGIVEKPFKSQIKDIIGKSKVYGMRNVPYKVLAERYKEYRSTGKNELALKALRMKMTMTKFLEDRVDATALAEIAEILLEEGLVDKAIEKTVEGLQLIHPLHAETVKYYCILVRAYYEKDSSPEADKYCFKAIGTLDFHWGQYHPLHSTIYSILAYLLIKYKENLEQAQALYKASLISCTRVLGPNHLRTADVYMDFGRLYLRMNNKEQALASIEKAYLIYDAATETSIEKYYIPLANAALQLATIMEDQRRFKEALPYARKAADLYMSLYGVANEMHISSLWLVICIAYSISTDDLVQDYCKKMFEAIEAREKSKERNLELDERMARIKENCVAAAILVITRGLSKEDKRKLHKLSEEIYAEWQQELGEVDQQETAYEAVSGTQNDTNRVVTLSNLDFDTKGRQFLAQFYEEAKHDGVIQYYKTLVSSLCKLYSKLVEMGLAKENEGRAQALDERSDDKETYKNILKVFERKNFQFLLISQQ